MDYTVPASRLWKVAEREALALRHDYLAEEHLVLAMLAEESGQAGGVLREVGLRSEAVRGWITDRFPPTPYRRGIGNPFGPKMAEAVDTAKRLALVSHREFVSTADLLLGLLSNHDGPTWIMLREMGVSPAEVQARTLEVSPAEDEPMPPALRPASTRTTSKATLWARRPHRWLMARKGVTNALMDNWGSVNLRLVNKKHLSGTLAGQPLSLTVHRRRGRGEGTLGSDRLSLAWDVNVAHGAARIELSGNLGGQALSIRADFDLEADPDSHHGRALSRCSIRGLLAGRSVHLDHMPHVGTFGAGPSRVIGVKGTIGSEEFSLLASTHGERSAFGRLGISASWAGEDLHLHGQLLPRTAHVYGAYEGPAEIILPVVLAGFHVLAH